MKKIFIKTAACLACFMLAASPLAACSCSSGDEGVTKAQVSSGYQDSQENELYKYDVFDDHISITDYIGGESDVIIPESIDGKAVTELESNAFVDCSEAVKTVKIPKTVSTIATGCFSGNKFDKIEVDGESEYYTVENGAVMNKAKTQLSAYPGASAAEEFTIPDTVTSIPSGVFSKCESLKKINIPPSVRTIDNFAFMGSGLTQAVLPEGVESLGMGAFWNCLSLETLQLPKSLTTIQAPETTCQGCTALKTVKGYDSTDAQKILGCEDLSAEYESLG